MQYMIIDIKEINKNDLFNDYPDDGFIPEGVGPKWVRNGKMKVMIE